MFKQTMFQWLASLLLIGGLIGVPMMAQAGPDEAKVEGAAEGATFVDRDAEAASDKPECVVLLDAAQEGEEFSKMTELGCYANFAEAVAAATGGAVELSQEATPETIEALDVELEQTVFLGTQYDCSNCRFSFPFCLRRINFFGLSGACRFRPFPVYRFNEPASFNNRASSVRIGTACPRVRSCTGFFGSGSCITHFNPFRVNACGNYPGIFNNTISSKIWSR